MRVLTRPMNMKENIEAKLALLKIQVRSEIPSGTAGYADFITEDNFPETGKTANSNLLRLEQLRPGTLSEFAGVVMGM